MNNGRNGSEKAAINVLRKLSNPEFVKSTHSREALINQFVHRVVDAAVAEMRKEMHQQLAANILNDTLEGDKQTAAEIVAKQLESEGVKLPRAAYEGPPPPPHHYEDYRKGGKH